MKKVIAIWGDGSTYANIPADRIVYEDGICFAFNGENLVGTFDIGVVKILYISEKESGLKEAGSEG